MIKQEDASDAEKRALDNFLVNCSELRALEKVLSRFNIFRVLGATNFELRHSNMLAWLLDPTENHGLADSFLRRWLMRIFHDLKDQKSQDSDERSKQVAQLSPIDVEEAKFREVQVLREWEHIDLWIRLELAQGQNWVFLIENKVDSSQGDGQLSRYKKNLRVQDLIGKLKARPFYVFLTRWDEEPRDPDYVKANYAQIRDVLKECLEFKHEVIGQEPRVLLTNYLRLLEEEFMSNSEVENLVQRICATHRMALDVISKYRKDKLAEITLQIRNQMEEQKEALGVHIHHSIKGGIWFLPRLWMVGDNANPSGDPPFFVWCELWVWEDTSKRGKLRTQIKLIEGHSPPNWRGELWTMSASSPFKRQRRDEPPSKWMTFYSERQTWDKDLDELDGDQVKELAADISAWLTNTLQSKDLEQVVKIVGEHLKKLPALAQGEPEPQVFSC